MWDLDVLEKCGCSAEAWRKVFERKDKKAKYPAKIEKLVNRFRSRIQGGIDFNLTNHALYHALDLAWDSPFQQLTPTLIQSFANKNVNADQTDDILKTWGIDTSDLWETMDDPKTPGQTIRKLNVSVMSRVVPQLLKSYVTMRWANLANTLNLVPLDKYDPSISDELSMMKAEVLNHRVEIMNQQMGAFETRKGAIWRMLHYGECLAFPVEEWYTETQIHGKDTKQKGEDFKIKDKVVGKKVLVKEGLRHHLPHPTRTFYGREHFPSGFNYGTGPKHAGYWRIVTYQDILDNKALYNTESVGISERDWDASLANAYFVNVYKGCVINFPQVTDTAEGGTSKMDSEKHVGNMFYTRDMSDKSVLQTEFFENLIPSEHGLGDYDCPVWCRFVIASDNTVMYASPVPYDPVIYYGCDNPGGRTLNAGMSLEIIPFQDQIANILTQILISSKQNLANVTFIDTDQFTEDQIQMIANLGEKMYVKTNFVPYSSMLAKKGMAQPGAAIIPHKFPQADVVSLYSALRTCIDLLERVLGMSSQEVGQPASHEQTKEEVKHIASSSSTRLEFTKLGVNAAQNAHRRQNFQALMAYGAESFYAQIALNPGIDEKKLTKYGFTVINHDPVTGKANVKVDKTAIIYETFIANRGVDDRVSDPETARQMMGLLQPIIEGPTMQPLITAAIGVDQSLKWFNYIGRMAGFPRDFKLVNITANQPPEPVSEPIKAFVDQAAKAIEEDVKGALTHLGDQVNSQGQQTLAMSQQLQSIQGTLQNLMQTAAQAPALPPPNALDTIQPQFGNSGPQFDPMAPAAGVPFPPQAAPMGA